MKIPAYMLMLAGAVTAQDIAPKDSERDPVLSALLEESSYVDLEKYSLLDGPPYPEAPVLVTGNPPLDANVVMDESDILIRPEPEGIQVEVEGGTSTTDFPAQDIRLLAPFPAKPLSQAPAGWKLIHPDTTPPLSQKVQLSNGSTLTLSVRPHVLVPDADGKETFALMEPGFDPEHGYAQKHTVGAILADSIDQLEDQAARLDAASRRLSELLDSLPQPTSNVSDSTPSEP